MCSIPGEFYFNELDFVVGIFSCNDSCFGVSGFRSSCRNAQPPLVPTCYPLLTLRKASGESCTTTSALARLQRPSPQTSLTVIREFLHPKSPSFAPLSSEVWLSGDSPRLLLTSFGQHALHICRAIKGNF